MIEKMKRLDAIFLMDDRNRFLTDLQALGVVHLESKASRGDEGLLLQELGRLRRAKEWLENLAQEYGAKIPPAPLKGQAGDFCQRVDEAKARLQRLDQDIRETGELALRLEAYGRFDPETVKALDRVGVCIAFCSCSLPDFWREGGESMAVQPLEQSHGGIHYVCVYHKNDELGESDKRLLSFQEDLPLEDHREVLKRLESLKEERTELLRVSIDDTRYSLALGHAADQVKDLIKREDAEASLESAGDGAVCVVSGFFPESLEKRVSAFLDERPVAYFIEEPSHHDEVPVKLNQGAFTRLFAPILRIYSLPNYHELDTTPFFAPFYTLFFGLCVADAGYGLIMLAVVLVAMLKIRNPALRPTLWLGFALSASVVFGGVILNDYFGFKMGEAGGAAEAGGAGLLMSLGFFREQKDAMLLPILLGVIQVIFGYLLRMANHLRRFGWQGAFLPLGVLFVIIGGSFGALGAVGPDFAVGPLRVGLLGALVTKDVWLGLIVAGLAFILFFNGLASGRKWYLRPLSGLWNLYELATGLPGDILSYLRLFALGLAGGLLAEAVNHIAGTMVEGSHNPFAFVAMAAVLIIGHGLNFGIGLLSAFVHSLRLTFVEFYKAVEFEGGGKPYDAFRVSSGEKPDYSVVSAASAAH